VLAMFCDSVRTLFEPCDVAHLCLARCLSLIGCPLMTRGAEPSSPFYWTIVPLMRVHSLAYSGVYQSSIKALSATRAFSCLTSYHRP